jgi:SAM-dependent methyltransferase
LQEGSGDVALLQRQKIERIEPILRREMPHTRRGIKYDFLSDELRAETAIAGTSDISSHQTEFNQYDDSVLRLIEECRDGLVLDCGAGRRPTYYPNVVNLEIFDFVSTDIIGVGEALPFHDACFDGVVSIAVLEHTRDPFACAKEIVRVLKPGGRLICCVPFLQPLHGYPHHYYNMSAPGLRALFERTLEIDDQVVMDSTLPVWSLTWMVRSWAAGLPERTREQFLSLRLADLLAAPVTLLERPWVRDLPAEKNFELASATILFAHKRAA